MGFSPANLLFFLWATSATVSGVVVNEAGLPVADAEVQLSPNDSEGRYRVLDLAPGEWTVNAQAGGLSLFETVTVPPDVPEAVHDFVLPPTFEVRGRVTDPEGEPLAGAELVFNIDKGGSMYITHKVGRDGTFLVRLKEGEHSVTASLPGYYGGETPRIVPVAGAAVDGVDFQLRRGAVLTGRLLEFGPFDGEVSIWASGPEGVSLSATNDPEGSYRIPGMCPGTWQIQATAGFSLLYPRKRGEGQITLLPGETEAVLDIVLREFTGPFPDEP